MTKDIYKVLVTGPPISGKTQVARKLEKDLSGRGLSVRNVDVDYNKDWRDILLCDVYMLQTPHGSDAEQEDGIEFNGFNRILYVNPDDETYKRFLAGRGSAWFEEGVVEKTEDFDPRPYSLEKLPKIIEKIAGYALKKKEIVEKDRNYFKENGLFRIVVPEFKNGELDFVCYSEILNEILGEIIG